MGLRADIRFLVVILGILGQMASCVLDPATHPCEADPDCPEGMRCDLAKRECFLVEGDAHFAPTDLPGEVNPPPDMGLADVARGDSVSLGDGPLIRGDMMAHDLPASLDHQGYQDQAPLGEVCQDGLDNDGDYLVDCDDPDCFLAAPCLPPRVLFLLGGASTMTFGLKEISLNDECEGWPPCLCNDLSCIRPTFGDGSEAFPGYDTDGNGLSDDSKLYIVKEAIASLVPQYGGIHFGLMRFHQVEGLEERRSPEQYLDGWGCTAYDERTACFGSTKPWPNPLAALNYDGYAEKCGGGDLLAPIEPEPQASLRWLDHREDLLGGDGEFRGDGEGPVASSLRSARDHLAALIASDPLALHRGHHIILMTDTEDTCGEIPEGESLALRSLEVGGVIHEVRTWVIGLGGQIGGSSQLERIAVNGGTSYFFATEPGDVVSHVKAILDEILAE